MTQLPVEGLWPAGKKFPFLPSSLKPSSLKPERQLMMCAPGEKEVIPRVRGRDHHGLAHLGLNFRPYTYLFRNLSGPLFTNVKMGIIAPFWGECAKVHRSAGITYGKSGTK